MRLISFSALALSLGAPAQAVFVGGGVVSLDSWNAAASAEIGSAVTVYRLYLAFDGQDPLVDRVNNVFDANFSAGGMLYQDALGGDTHPNAAFLPVAPELEWDSFVSLNTRTSADGAAVSPDGSFAFTDTGVGPMAGWFLAGSDQGLAGTNPDGDYGSGYNLVLIGQFTVMGGTRAGDIVHIRDDGFLGDGGVFSGQLSIGIHDTSNPSIEGVIFDIPAPGATTAFFVLAGIGTRRRRR